MEPRPHLYLGQSDGRHFFAPYSDHERQYSIAVSSSLTQAERDAIAEAKHQKAITP